MNTSSHKQYRSRAAIAADLISTLDAQLPLGHPARATVRELQKLFSRRTRDMRELLEQVPGTSLAQKGEAIGIPRGSVWAIWKGLYLPSPDIIAKIEAAIEKSESVDKKELTAESVEII